MKNKYEIRGDITAIFCKHKGKIYETIIDTDDLPLAESFPNAWFLIPSRDKKYLYVVGKYWLGNNKVKQTLLHRLLTDAPEGMEVDHFNHDTLNNRRSTNLRVITSGENNQNLLDNGRVNNKSCGIRGVTLDIRTGNWMVQVRLNKKCVYSGRFDTKEEAERAAREARAVHLPYSIEAVTIEVKDPGKYLNYREMPTKRNKSGVKHIWFSEREGKWKARVKRVYLGSFSTKEQAADAVKEYKELLSNPA